MNNRRFTVNRILCEGSSPSLRKLDAESSQVAQTHYLHLTDMPVRSRSDLCMVSLSLWVASRSSTLRSFRFLSILHKRCVLHVAFRFLPSIFAKLSGSCGLCIEVVSIAPVNCSLSLVTILFTVCCADEIFPGR